MGGTNRTVSVADDILAGGRRWMEWAGAGLEIRIKGKNFGPHGKRQDCQPLSAVWTVGGRGPTMGRSRGSDGWGCRVPGCAKVVERRNKENNGQGGCEYELGSFSN